MAAEEAFPRGGGRTLTGLERKRLRQEAEAEAERDFQAELRSTAKRPKSAKDGDQGAFLTAGRLPDYVEVLRFKKLSVGAKIWGVVSAVHLRELAVSLPQGLRAQVAYAEAADALHDEQQAAGSRRRSFTQLSDIFHVGQFVRAVITGLGGRDDSESQPDPGQQPRKGKQVSLSLRLSRLQHGQSAKALSVGTAIPACISSVEDHGYLVDFGIKGAQGFLAFDAAGSDPGAKLRVGQLLETAIVNADSPAMLHVTAERAPVASALLTDHARLDMSSLLPGTLVNARVRRILSDGLVVSFLMYFQGSVDTFHLREAATATKWAAEYKSNQRLKARILYVDPAEKRICLSLKPHLVGLQPASGLPLQGAIIENAAVRRVDNALGATLELPADPTRTLPEGSEPHSPAAVGFAHVSSIGEQRIDRLDKALRIGSTVKARVMGSRPFEGIATLTLKPSAVDRAIEGIRDLQPGGIVTGSVSSTEDFGLFVSITSNLRGLVPWPHTTNLAGPHARRRMKPGHKVTARILEVQPSTRRVTLTLKRALLDSKLPIISSLQGITVGMRSHGTVTGIQEYGVFLGFYGGVSGLAPAAELGLAPSQKPADAFELGQVVKAQVVSVDPEHNRLRLSLASATSAAADATETNLEAAEADAIPALSAGSLASGVISSIVRPEGKDGALRPPRYIVNLTAEGSENTMPGQLEGVHLSDHPAGAAALQGVLQVGDSVGQLLVLETLPGQSTCRVTRKPLLIANASNMPGSIEDVSVGGILAGVVSNVTPDSVFVRFLEGLTGRAALTQLADAFVSDPSAHFTAGQTVRALVQGVDADKGRISLSLKPSATATPDATLAACLFRDIELADSLRNAREADAAAVVDWSQLKLGVPAAGRVHELQPYGVLYDLDAHPDLVGLITTAQQDGKAEVGQQLSTRVLDINKKDGIIDLTTKTALVQHVQQPAAADGKPRKKCKRETTAAGLPADLKEGQKVEACVELIKDDYLVVSLPQQHAAIGCAGVQGYNQRSLGPHTRFRPGQRLPGTVAALPSDATGGRLLLHVPLTPISAPAAAAEGDKRDRSRPSIAVGTLVKGTVVLKQPLHLELQLPQGLLGQLHITQVVDTPCASDPLERFAVGDTLEAVCIGAAGLKGGRQRTYELSTKPSTLAAAADGKPVRKPLHATSLLRKLRPGSTVHGFVQEVAKSFAWVVLDSGMRARLHALDSSADRAEVARFSQRFHVGQPVSCRILKVNKQKAEVDLSYGSAATLDRPEVEPAAKAVFKGTVARVSGQGVTVDIPQIGSGIAALTDLHDAWVPDALAGFSEGQAVTATLLPPAASTGSNNRRRMLQLVLKPSACKASSQPAPADTELTEADLKAGQQVQGYVKSAGKAGVFVQLSRSLDARVRLSNLADGFVADPEAAFPSGKHIKGWIVSAAPGKVEVTLKQLRGGWHNLDPTLTEGSTVRGVVKRAEAFGVFVQLLQSDVRGMAHVSELADGYVKSPAELFQPGQVVRAKVLKLDRQQQRLSLGLKPSYFEGEEEELAEAAGGSDNELDLDAEMVALSDDDSDESADADLPGEEASASEEEAASQEAASESGSEDDSDAESESEASDAEQDQPPVVSAVQLDGVGWGEDEAAPATANPKAETPATDAQQQNADATQADAALTKRQRQKRKRAEEEATRAAEAARLAAPAPGDTIALEKAVAENPNSSLAWIQFMAFHISTGELAAARAVAQRALDTIHFREEGEKRNVRVAWLNLEGQYGDPPEEAVMKLFHQSLPYSDPKKLHFALLDVLQRAKLEALHQETLKAVTRRFSGSAKAWLAHIRHCIARKEVEAAQKLMERALSSLPQRKHIKVLSQTALAHFRDGSQEQGRNLLENMLRSFPKRLDLWNLYLDQEIKLGDQARVRALFSRATHAQLPPKKMRAMFKRFMEYEQAHGNAASVADVQKAAQQYVDTHL